MIRLEVVGLTKRYGENVALNGVTVTFTPGIYGLLGANGAGKSTLMNLITDNINEMQVRLHTVVGKSWIWVMNFGRY